jgi:hypothetical protein
MSQKFRPLGNFSAIFDAVEFKWPFKKPQVVQDFGRSLE